MIIEVCFIHSLINQSLSVSVGLCISLHPNCFDYYITWVVKKNLTYGVTKKKTNNENKAIFIINLSINDINKHIINSLFKKLHLPT